MNPFVLSMFFYSDDMIRPRGSGYQPPNINPAAKINHKSTQTVSSPTRYAHSSGEIARRRPQRQTLLNSRHETFRA